MRIALLTRNFSRTAGGAESYAIAIARELSDGHEVHVFCQETDEPIARAIYHRVWRPFKRPRWLNQMVYALITWWLTRSGFDVVHSHEHVFFGQIQTLHVQPVAQGIWGQRRGWRKALRWLSVLTSPRRLTYMWLEAARMRVQPGRQLVFASQQLLAQFSRYYPGIASISHVITPGVQLPGVPLSRSACRQSLGWGAGDVRLLFVANDYTRKGLDTLLTAMTRLPSHVLLNVAGQTRQKATYTALANQLGLSERVSFMGPRNDIDVLMAASDLLVHPTLEDSFGMVVLEAMAQKLAVVVSGSPYCGLSAELTHMNDAWLLADPRDANKLAGAIQHLLLDADTRQKLIEHGWSQAQNRGWPAMALAYQKLFEINR
jgi:glycosyltransferase involved in cell wall biosynthesis